MNSDDELVELIFGASFDPMLGAYLLAGVVFGLLIAGLVAGALRS